VTAIGAGTVRTGTYAPYAAALPVTGRFGRITSVAGRAVPSAIRARNARHDRYRFAGIDSPAAIPAPLHDPSRLVNVLAVTAGSAMGHERMRFPATP
jgi:hypothetical protein